MINTNSIVGGADYYARRWTIIDPFETQKYYSYVDSKGFATIGVGFLISSHVREILLGMNPDMRTYLGLTTEGYNNLIDAIESAVRDSAGHDIVFASVAAAQAAILTALFGDASNGNTGVLTDTSNFESGVVSQNAREFLFQYSSDATTAETQMQATFNAIANSPTQDTSTYELVIDQWLNGSLGNPNSAIAQSRERLALYSLAYNGLIGFNSTGTLKSPSLRNAILNSDRAEAWYEIRYNSNNYAKNYLENNIIGDGSDKGIAKRRYAEAEIFGIFDNPNSPTEMEAKSAYRMLTRHREYVFLYEAAYGQNGTRGDQLAEADAYNIAFNGIDLVTSYINDQYKPAFNLIKSSYLSGINTAIDWQDIYVGENKGSTSSSFDTRYYRGTDNDVLIGSNRNDLMIGESGADIMVGNGGSNVFYGGSGFDVYKIDGDVIDNITDEDGKGVIVNGPDDYPNILSVAVRNADANGNYSGNWVSRDGNTTYSWSGNAGDPLTITTQSQTITINNYKKGDLHLNLINLPSDPMTPPDSPVWDAAAHIQRNGTSGSDRINSPDYLDLDGDGTPDQLDSITGTKGSETIHGQGGDDDIFGFAGGDRLYGDSGNDVIYAGIPDTSNLVGSYLEGGTGRDVLVGDNANDHLVGGDSNNNNLDDASNFLYGGKGNDYLEAGSKGDVLVGGYGNDLIIGGVGGDYIYGSADIYPVYIDSIFTVRDWSVSPDAQSQVPPTLVGNTFQFQPVQFTGIEGTLTTDDTAGDVMYGGKGNDYIQGGLGNDYIDGGDNDDALFGGGGDDIIIGGNGADWITGDSGNNVLYGGAGNDFIWGNQDSSDTLSTNIIYGGSGNDVVFGGYGDDIIDGGENDDQIYGNDGNDILIGGKGLDYLNGGAGRDTYIFNQGDGTDYITDPDFQTVKKQVNGQTTDVVIEGKNKIVFGAGITSNDITLHKGSLAIQYDTLGDTVHIEDFDPNNAYNALSFDQIDFADGTSMSYAELIDLGFDIDGTANDDVLTGTNVVDRIHGYEGNDTISSGDGNDVLYGDYGFDTLMGEGGNDILYGGGLEDVLDGGDGDDILDGGYEHDTLIGGAGNDILGGDVLSEDYYGNPNPLYPYTDQGNTYIGGTGDDLYRSTRNRDHFIFNLGDGHDTISFTTVAGVALLGRDVIEFGPGITQDMVTVVRDANDLMLQLNSNDSIRILNWYTDTNTHLEVSFTESGTGWTMTDLETKARTTVGTEGDDVLNGLIDDSRYGDILMGLGGNDILYGNKGGDTLYGGDGNDQLYGGDGNDTLDGGAGDDLLFGDDINRPDFGYNNYLFGRGSGHDTIIDYSSYNKIKFYAGVVASDIDFGRSGNDLVLTIRDTGDSLTIKDYLSNTRVQTTSFIFTNGSHLPSAQQIIDQVITINGTAGNDVLEGTDYIDKLYGNDGDDIIHGYGDNDQLFGGNGSDLLDGGTGNDVLNGGTGNDTYFFDRGFGQDVIIDTDSTIGNVDTIAFADSIKPSDLWVTRDASNLYVRLDGTTDQITVQNWFASTSSVIEQITFADGTVWNTADISALANKPTQRNDYIVGTDSADVIYSLDGSDIVYGKAGDDYIDGGNGADRLYGGAGNDILVGGNDNDSIYGDQGDDLLYGGNGDDVIYTGSGINTVTGGKGNDQINALEDWSQPDAVYQNTYKYNVGDGFDRIYNDTETYSDVQNHVLKNDVIVFGEGIAIEDIKIQKGVEVFFGTSFVTTVVISVGDGEGIVFQSWNDPDVSGGVIHAGGYTGTIGDEDVFLSKLVFADGTELSRSQFLNMADNGITAYYGYEVKLSETNILGSDYDDWFIGGTYGVDNTTKIMNLRGGDDVIQGFYGKLIVDAGTGNDDIDSGYNGNSIIAGNKGDDSVILSGYNNTYLFNGNDGNDVLRTDKGQNNTDTISFGQNVRPEDLTVYKDGTHIVLGLAGGRGSISIDWYKTEVYGGSNVNDKVRYAQFVSEGQVTRYDLMSLIDSLYTPIHASSSANPISLFTSGNMSAYQVSTQSVTGGSYATAYAATGDMFAQLGTSGNNTLSVTGDVHTLGGLEGDDTLIGGTGRDRLVGGTGNDIMIGGAASDTYVLSNTTDNDVIIDIEGLRDTVLFSRDITQQNIFIAQDNNDLLVTFINSSGSLRIQDWFLGNQIETFEFDDGSELSLAQIQARIGVDPTQISTQTPPVLLNPLLDQTTSEDSVFTFVVPDNAFYDSDPGDSLSYTVALDGGASLPAWLTFDATTRTFTGTPGNNDVGNLSIVVTATDTSGASVADTFTLQINNVNDAPVVATPISAESAVEGTTFTLNVANHFNDVDIIHGDKLSYTISSADGGSVPAWLSLDSTAGILSGTASIDSHLVGSSGDDVITDTDNSSSSYNLRITATDMAGSNVSTDFLLSLQGVAGNDLLEGLDGNDTLNSGAGDDTLIGGTGNDTLYGGAGNDTYIFNVGDGTDVIYDSNTNGDVNTVVFGAGVDPNSITLSLGSLVLNYGNGDALHIADFDPNNAYQSQSITNFQFADGTVLTYADLINKGFDLVGTSGNDVITGTNVADRITGGAGDDLLVGGDGNDTYFYNMGDGLDTINDSAGANVVVLGTGISINNTVIRQQNGVAQLRLLDADGNETSQGINIMLNADGTSPIQIFQFADGSTTTIDNLVVTSMTWYGTKSDNTILTGRNDDVIYADSGNDIVFAGSGNDTVYGGSGADILNGDGGNDILMGEGGIDTLNGGAGNDYLDGGKSNDYLTGGKGNDTLIVGNDTDYVFFGRGDGWDTISADTSVKTLAGANVQFGQDVSALDLWFEQVGNDLAIHINGSNDGMTVQGWYNTTQLVSDIKVGNGADLTGSQVNQLITAMAQFSQDTGLSWSQAIQQQPDQVNQILSTYWQQA